MHLVLSSFGTVLQRENEQFAVINDEGKKMLSPRTVRSISISKGAKISSDAVLLAIENEIDVMFIDFKGVPQGRVWSVKYGSISTIRKNQMNFIFTPAAVSWIKDVIASKIDNQIALLLSLGIEDEVLVQRIKNAINRMNDYKMKVKQVKGEVISDIASGLRGWEGSASRVYFETLGMLLPEKYRIEGRTQHPAKDIFNCLLNYAYGMLYGKIEGALIKAGIDPYLGIFHRDDYNRPVLVFDVIELFRVWVDYVVIVLCMQDVIDEDCYSIKDGVYWLENMGKRILIQSVNDYFDEVISWRGLERSRATHLTIYAQNLAQMFLKS